MAGMNKTYGLIIGLIVILVIIAAVTIVIFSVNPTSSAYFGAGNYITLQQEKDKNKEILLGAIQPLTGNAANFGENTKIAIQMAVDEINTQGGVEGRRLKIIFEDGKCTAQDAITSAEKLISVDKVSAIIGGLCSSEALAIAPIAEKAKVVMLSNGASSPALSDSGKYIFRDYPSDSDQGRIAADFSFKTLGARKAAILYWASDWPIGIKKVFRETFVSLGGEITTEESFATGTGDMRTQLLKISSTRPDVIYLLAHTTETITGIKQANELGIKTTLIGGEPWDDAKIWTKAGDSNDKRYFVNPKMQDNFEFNKKFTALGGELMPGTQQGYDAVYILANAFKKCGENGECIKDYLNTMPTYKGVSGKIKFDTKGDLANPEFEIKTVQNQVIQKIKNAN
ncbi:MAG: ABC transporter substrate-binding protein [Candidatus Diapherotrites archaeon]|nr:ABC transporter substrate-binding protein [Candidatus Diapherotrites archaeon]